MRHTFIPVIRFQFQRIFTSISRKDSYIKATNIISPTNCHIRVDSVHLISIDDKDKNIIQVLKTKESSSKQLNTKEYSKVKIYVLWILSSNTVINNVFMKDQKQHFKTIE